MAKTMFKGFAGMFGDSFSQNAIDLRDAAADGMLKYFRGKGHRVSMDGSGMELTFRFGPQDPYWPGRTIRIAVLPVQDL